MSEDPMKIVEALKAGDTVEMTSPSSGRKAHINLYLIHKRGLSGIQKASMLARR